MEMVAVNGLSGKFIAGDDGVCCIRGVTRVAHSDGHEVDYAGFRLVGSQVDKYMMLEDLLEHTVYDDAAQANSEYEDDTEPETTEAQASHG